MKSKEVDDVLGGKEAWDNVDKTDSEFCGFFSCVFGRTGGREGGEEEGRRGYGF